MTSSSAGVKCVNPRLTNHRLMLPIIFIAGLLSLFIPTTVYGPDYGCVYLGSRHLLEGQSPYLTDCYIYPIWVAVAALPLALLPINLSYRLYLVIAFSGILLSLRSFQNWRLAWLLGIPLIIMTWLWGNIDWLIVAGYVLPLPLAWPLLLAKPQLGFVLAGLLFWQTRRQRSTQISAVLIALGFGLSWLLGMSWSGATTHAIYVGPNLAEGVWPWLLPIGFILTFLALRQKQRFPAILAALCFAPYVGVTAPLVVEALATDLIFR